MINKKECKKLINKILNKKRFYESDNYLLELFVQLYLILIHKRKLAEVFIAKKIVSKSTRKNLFNFLNKKYKYYIIKEENDYGYLIIIYDKKYDINKINQKMGKKYAQNLGDFYTCASNDMTNKHIIRPVISVSYYSKPYRKYKNHIYFELLAQMCTPYKYGKNIYKFLSIKDKYQKYLNKINKGLLVEYKVQ